MSVQVIVLNGGSSAGKSSIARHLQALLTGVWLTLGTDTLVAALPASLRESVDGITFAADGTIATGEVFRRVDTAWSLGVAQIARAGVPVIVDEVFLGGAASQARWQAALAGLTVLWVGVQCDPEIAAAREAARGDRVTGMARTQAALVHRGVQYDLTVDTTGRDALACAHLIAAQASAGAVSDLPV